MSWQADRFRTESPYGIIINLSNLRYSFFNRNYKEQNNKSDAYLPWDELYSFENIIEDESAIEKLKDFATKYELLGTAYRVEKRNGIDYLSIWLYNDRNFPFDSKGARKNLLNQYFTKINEVEKILNTGIFVYC